MSYLIVAADKDFGIAKNDHLPWGDSESGRADMKFFVDSTKYNAVIYGRKTFESLGCKPLRSRINIVVTNNQYSQLKVLEQEHTNLYVYKDIHSAIKFGYKLEDEQNIRCFICGGNQIYTTYMEYYQPKEILYSRFDKSYNCDIILTDKLWDYMSEFGVGMSYKSTNIEECRYLDLFEKVLANGAVKEDRTGTGTISYFSPPQLEFDLEDNTLPLLTTKRVAIKTGVLPELLWFIRGQTNTQLLEDQKCYIWRGNTTREFLDSRGLTSLEEKDMGPGYGFQWRHAGAEYKTMHDNYEGQGVDQLQTIVDQLRQDPDSRRMVMTAWNAAALDEMALPPCHILYQVYTRLGEDGKRYLSAKMYQRSADSFLGVPFNISSYALLTHLLAAMCGYEPDRLILTFGDYHIYKNHVAQVKQQLLREPRPFPKLHFTRDMTQVSLDEVATEDFLVTGYNPHPKISAPMAV